MQKRSVGEHNWKVAESIDHRRGIWGCRLISAYVDKDCRSVVLILQNAARLYTLSTTFSRLGFIRVTLEKEQIFTVYPATFLLPLERNLWFINPIISWMNNLKSKCNAKVPLDNFYHTALGNIWWHSSLCWGPENQCTDIVHTGFLGTPRQAAVGQQCN